MKPKDETPLEFFSKLEVPETWKLLGDKNWAGSLGKVYRVDKETVLRIYFMTASRRGGVCEKSLKLDAYKCLIDNKNSDKINEFIQNNYDNCSRL
jgi:hypothetical protein